LVVTFNRFFWLFVLLIRQRHHLMTPNFRGFVAKSNRLEPHRLPDAAMQNKRRDRHRQTATSSEQAERKFFSCHTHKSIGRGIGHPLSNLKLFSENFRPRFFQCTADLGRRKEHQPPDFHVGNAPCLLLVTQPAQRGPALVRKEDFQQPGAIDELVR
jgi:hypothetical protein